MIALLLILMAKIVMLMRALPRIRFRLSRSRTGNLWQLLNVAGLASRSYRRARWCRCWNYYETKLELQKSVCGGSFRDALCVCVCVCVYTMAAALEADVLKCFFYAASNRANIYRYLDPKTHRMCWFLL